LALSSRKHLWWIAAAVFVLGGPFMGIVAFRLADRLEHERASALCAEYFSDRAAALSRELHEITDELRHLRSLFLSTDRVTRAQFRAFTSEIPARHPAVVAMEWVPRVPGRQRDAHERQAHTEGLSGYTISTYSLGGGLKTAPVKDEYYPVYFAEPLDRNQRVIGFDISSENSRLSAIVWATLTRELSLSDPVDLMPDPDPSQGFLALLPVYRSNARSPADAEDHPEGLVLLVVRAREVFARMLGVRGESSMPDMRFELVDTDVDGRPVVIGASSTSASEPHYGNWTYVESIEIGGQRWRLTGRPTNAYVASHLTREPVFLGIGVFFLWELLGGFALSVVRQARDAAFRRQTRVFETALRGLSEGVIVADATGRFILFNDAAERMLGLRRLDVALPEWSATWGCIDPVTQAPFPPERLPLARAMQGEEAQADVLIRNAAVPDGVWITVSGTPLRDENGDLDGGVVTFRDITASRKAEAHLRASIKQLEDLRYAVDQASLVATTDLSGNIISLNDKFSEVSGFSRAELLGQNHRILNSGYHPKAFFEDLWNTITSGKVWRGRIRNTAKDGHHFWVETTIVPVLENGRPERYLSLRTDVTEEVRRGAELQRLSNAVEQTADAIVITDAQGTIEYVNPAFEATTGYSREEAVGQTPRIIRSGRQSDAYYEHLWATIRRGDVFRGTPINRRKTGEFYHAEQTITPIKDSEGHIVHFVSVIKDVTDRVRIEAHEIEMRYAADVQQKLYPLAAPTVEGFDIAGGTFPALATCGDYYDFLPIREGRLDIVIADVSGHGLGPALIMAETRAYLRFVSGSCDSPGEVLTTINKELCGDLDDNRYVALILARLDMTSRRLSYTNAGHTFAYHLSHGGAVKAVLESCGPPLGVFPDQLYENTFTPALDPGDIVVFLTDGVTETEDTSGQYFGVDAALDCVRSHRDEPAEQIVRHLQQATREFAQGAPQQDDVTVIVFKVDR
jgi:sigma-B regulation protein RsbU (phosphoserine phosphatase)